jgi:hypothetical protein
MVSFQAPGRQLWEIAAMSVQPPQSELLSTWLEPFRSCLTRPTFRHALVLVAGAILTPGRRTITAMLNVVGLSQAPTFTNYHRVLNRNRWSSRELARRLLGLFSLVTLWTNNPGVRRLVRPRCAAWYEKRAITFSDALAAVRRSLWATALSQTSREPADITKAQTVVLHRLTTALCYPA